MKTWYTISRIFLALVFLVSGFTKSIDPFGTAIKFEEYFIYVFKFEQLKDFALPFAFIMCALEFSLGLMLLLNITPKLTAWLSALFMIIFTPLTLYLAIYNPISDCGCFGDAIKFTNWQTFWKNIVIDVFLLIYIFTLKSSRSVFTTFSKILGVSLIFILALLFELYNHMFLPIIDFLPYKKGANIAELMKIPADAPKDEYKITLVYKNLQTGEIKEFPEENYPWNDTTWQWIETKTVLVKKGYVPPIHDFILLDVNKNDRTNEFLSLKDTAVLVVVYDFEHNKLLKVKNFLDSLKKHRKNLMIFGAFSVDYSILSQLQNSHEFEDWILCTIDNTTAKTIIRSSPGLVFVKNAVVLEKLSYNSLNKKTLRKLLK